MPFFLAALIGGLATAMGSLVGRAMIALGIGVVSYTGISMGIDQIKQQVVTSLSGLPVDAINLLAFFWIDKALTVIFSATAVALTMQLTSGSLKKIVVK